MTTEIITRLRELLAKAAPGPWYVDYTPKNDDDGTLVRSPDRRWWTAKVPFASEADLIVAAVNALPALLDRLEKLEAVLCKYEWSSCDGCFSVFDKTDDEAYCGACGERNGAPHRLGCGWAAVMHPTRSLDSKEGG